MKKIVLLFALLVLNAPSSGQSCPVADVEAVPRAQDKGWIAKHARAVAAVKAGADTVLIGDSFVERFPRDLAERAFGRGVANAGVGGDTVGNVLWRVRHMDLSQARNVWMIAGANDLAQGRPARTTAAAILALVQSVRLAAPKAQLHLREIVPTRGSDWLDRKIRETNGVVRRCVPSGVTVHATAAVGGDAERYSDAVHLSREGYLKLIAVLGIG